MKNKLLPLAVVLMSTAAYSQVGIGNLNPNSSSQLDISAENKGVLIPRVKLISDTDASTITPGNVNSLLVFNETDSGSFKPGYYYWYTDKWLKLATSQDLADLDLGGTEILSLEVIGSDLVLKDSFGHSTQVPILDINIVTTLVNNGDGTYTYTSEDGTVTTIDVPADVINNFEEIINNSDVLNTIIEQITNTSVGGNVYFDGNSFTYVDSSGNSQTINIEEIVKGFETVTTLVNNGDGTYTYTSEDGTVTTIDVPADVINNFEEIINNNDVLNTIIEQITNTSVGGNVYFDGNSFTYVDSSGNSQTINMEEIVKGYETVTTLVDNGTSFTYTNELGDAVTVNLSGGATGPQGPQGIQGIPGESSYEIWEKQPGNTGKDETEYLESIKGEQGIQGVAGPAGPQGSQGESSYEVWLRLPGNAGKDEVEYFESLKGEQGIQGVAGPAGPKGDQGDEGPQGPAGTAVEQTITHTLGSSVNTLTSTVNSISRTADIINTNVLTLTGPNLTSTVNGVASSPAIDISRLEPWNVQGSATKATSNDQDIYQMGSVAIGAAEVATVTTSSGEITPKLYVDGDVHISGKMYTSNSKYADYVFEKYFTGESAIDSDYKFNELKDVKEFIKKNHHLPGVTRIGDLMKTDNGYVIDFSKLSVEQLEKIEELYIHTIEQQDLIDQQSLEIGEMNTSIDELKNTNEKYLNLIDKQSKEIDDMNQRVERLEKLLKEFVK